MPAHSLQDLAGQLGAFIGAAAPALVAAPDGSVAFAIEVDGVDVTVSHDEVADGDEAVVYVAFGNLPALTGDESAKVLLRMNLEMRHPRAPCFCLDMEQGEVVLKYAYSLPAASGQALWEGLRVIAEMAMRWRDGRFEELPDQLTSCADFA
jgi:hypothetical protein